MYKGSDTSQSRKESPLGDALRGFANARGRGYPDWAVRYVPVANAWRRRLPRDSRVLEIGANENGIARFLDVQPIAVDRSMAHLRAAHEHQSIRAIAGSLDALPFVDGCMDACVCMDTFEHVADSMRETALREIARVLKPGAHAVVAFPAGAGAAEAEARIRDAYRAYTGREFRWLAEHADIGLPDIDRIRAAAERAFGAGYRVRVGKNANLTVWTWMWRILICGWPGRGNALFQALVRVLTPVWVRLHVGRCYRAMIWIEPRHE